MKTDGIEQQSDNYQLLSLLKQENLQDTSDVSLKSEPMWRMPTTFIPLIGREQDVAAVCALLKQPEMRLLTLLGPAGIGKTRLGLEVATAIRAYFADGVCFVSFAAVRNPNLVIPTLAQELGIQELGTQSLFKQVQAALHDKHLLLLLDNFEQIVMGAFSIEALLGVCPRLQVVVTSRAVLHLQSEHQFPVSPLALPPLDQLPEGERLSQYAAVALFVERAQAVLPAFRLTQTNVRAIAEICVRLDGLPLAIELAAARIKLFPPQALLTRLSQRFQVLSGGTWTLPVRQQTLRNTLQWSYDLLDEEEQWLFRHLSIFVGGCTFEAVEAICIERSRSGLSALDGVASLLDKSLLMQTEQEGDEPRFMMLETIREYGLVCLRECKEAEASQKTHALYHLALLEEAEPHLKGAQQLIWLERLEREQENLRTALWWLIEHKEGVLTLHFCAALEHVWLIRGYLSEGLGVCASLSEEAFAVAWAKGQTMTLEQARSIWTGGAVSAPVSIVSQSPRTLEPSLSHIYPDDLTTREMEVLRLLAQGWTDTQIATHLVISPRTVNTHLTSIYQKIQVSTRSAATRYALEHKIS